MKATLLVVFGFLFFLAIPSKSFADAPGFPPARRAIIPIAAFAAEGDEQKLENSLVAGLESGLSVNAIKEILIQTYAYAGFPRSLSALEIFRKLVERRKAEGINDKSGSEPKTLSKDADKLAIGEKIQTELVGRKIGGQLYDFAPEMNVFLREHLFCDIFSRGILSNQERELATISILAALPAPVQLASHLRVRRHIGLTLSQLKTLASCLSEKVSSRAGELVDATLDKMEFKNSEK